MGPRSGHQTLPAWFREASATRGPTIAMRWKHLGIWNGITWNDYAGAVGDTASALLASGCRRGDKVVVLSNNRPEWCYVEFGAQYAGLVPVGVYATDSPAQLDYVLKDCAARIVFVEGEEQLDKAMSVLDRNPGVERLVYFDASGLHGFSHPRVTSFDAFRAEGRVNRERNPSLLDAEIDAAKPDDIALIIYTSGSTGKPKGAMLSHRNIIFQMAAMNRLSPGRVGDEQLSFLPMSHIVERYFTAYRPLDHGAVVNFGEGMAALIDNLREVKPHTIMAVPRVWEKLHAAITMAISDATPFAQWGYRTALNIGYRVAALSSEGKSIPITLRVAHFAARHTVLSRVLTMTGLRRTRVLISGAAPISPDVVTWYRALGLIMVEAYGQTECTGHATSYIAGEERTGTVGKAIAGTELRIAANGEIMVKGPHVFKGYLNQPQHTAEAVVDGWLHTGDVGMLDQDGYLTVTDRIKDIIVTSGGKNVTPSEIEARLKFSPYISDAVVIGDGRHYLTCLIMIDHESVAKFAQEKDVPFSNFASLTRADVVRSLIQAEIDAVNRDFARAENIRRFEFIESELTAEDEEMTPTLKLKRRVVAEKYRPLIERMYSSGSQPSDR
jgi:long-chain acyl-CoA synthetase